MNIVPPRAETKELQFALNDIYNHLNNLYKSSEGTKDIEPLGSGKSGDIRVVQKSNRETGLEIKIDQGWFSSLIYPQSPNITKLTDNGGSSVTANNTIEAITADATVKDAIKELSVKLNEVIDIINSVNNSGFEITQEGRR
jgi:hypothetical protein